MESLKDRVEDWGFLLRRKYRVLVDKSSVHPRSRWASLVVLCLLYALRIATTDGYAVITYLLGLFYLNQIMLYLTPLEDPEELEFPEEYVLPVRETDEFKGFQRKIQELELWLKLTQATLACMAMTLFEMFAFPIFWPLLVFYFILMTTFLCRYKIEHMIKYRYIPFDFGKKTYRKP